MGIGNFIQNKIKQALNIEPAFEVKSSVTTDFSARSYGPNYAIVSRTFDGEKTLGELGTVIKSIPDYQKLRLRMYDAYLKTDTVKILVDKHVDWTVGSGMKLQSEPNENVLEMEGISLDYPKFQKSIESRFNLYANTKYFDYSEQKTLHQIANDVYKSVFLGGDGLVVCRYGEYGINVQFIPGEHIKTPLFTDPLMEQVIKSKNYVKHGIEFDSKGKQVAFYVEKFTVDNPFGEFERIPVYGKNSRRKLAWMVYGQKISSDHVRGIPEMSQTLEKLNKLDRYTEAAVTKAEQAANVVYSIEHEAYSTGEDPIAERLAQKIKTVNPDLPDSYELANGLAQKMTETTSGTTYNMPNGASLKAFSTDIETNYEAFELANFNRIAAAANVPPEVALQSYNSNYSASRAAINGWGFVVNIDRNDFALDFYIPIFKLWLEYEILQGKINAPGYISALNRNDFMIVEAYSKCRFIGKNMPHIDPLKEAKAIELMLDKNLISYEQATEMLNVGEWNENYANRVEEDKLIKENTPIVEPINSVNNEVV